MLILTIRTDKPEAEIGLYDNLQQLAYLTWPAHRELAETLHHKIKELLDGQGQALEDVQGVVVYDGPGSFTGLRIGISVANALATALRIPIIGSGGEDWLAGLRKVASGKSEPVVPEYGAPVHITKPKK